LNYKLARFGISLQKILEDGSF